VGTNIEALILVPFAGQGVTSARPSRDRCTTPNVV